MKKSAFFSLFIPLLIFMTAELLYGQPRSQYGGIVRIIELSEGAQPLGAPWEIRGIEATLVKPVFDPLVREDKDGNLHPWLANEWKIDTKNNTITVVLRRGVRFHDGTDFNAEVAKWCIDQSIQAKTLKGFKSVDVIDPYTIRINIDRYQNNLLHYLATSYMSPVSPATYKKMGKEWAMWNPVGTGPFKFATYERGSKVSFKRWEEYWQRGKPYLDGIEFLLIRDPMTQQAAMLAPTDQRVHILGTTSAEQAAMMKSRGFTILSSYEGTLALYPDSANPDSPLSKKKVRQAISYAINREDIAKTRGFGFQLPANQICPPDRTGHFRDSELGIYDPSKAKQLLLEAGYPNGFKMKIIAQPALVDKDTLVIIQHHLERVGIQVELEFPDAGKYNAYRLKDGWKNACLAQATRVSSTANITFNFYFHTYGGQYPSLRRPDGFVESLEASLNTPLPEKRMMEKLSKMLIDEATVIPINHTSEFRILHPIVRDTGYFDWSPATIFTPEQMWLEK